MFKFSYTFIFLGAVILWHVLLYGSQDFVFLLLNIFTRFGIEFGMSKQLTGPSSSRDHSLTIICKKIGANSCDILLEPLPILSLALVAYIVLKCISYAICQRFWKYFVFSGTILSYVSIAFHWASESTLFSHTEPIREFGRSFAPRFVYAIGGLSLAISALYRLLGRTDYLKANKRITSLSVAMLCSWSPTILILLGRQGPFVALIFMTGGTVQNTLFPVWKGYTTTYLWFQPLFCSLVYHKVTAETSERHTCTLYCSPCFGCSMEPSCSLSILSDWSLVCSLLFSCDFTSVRMQCHSYHIYIHIVLTDI
jgi:hypothetical protein